MKSEQNHTHMHFHFLQKAILCVTVVLFSIWNCEVKAQSRSVKAYSSFLFLNSSAGKYLVNDPRGFKFNGASLAYQYGKGKFREIEMGFFSSRDRNSTTYAEQHGGHIRFETGRYMKKPLFRRIPLLWTHSFMVQYSYADVQSIHTVYPTEEMQLAMGYAPVWHYLLDIGNRWFIDFNVSLVSIYLGYEKSTFSAPGLDERYGPHKGFYRNVIFERDLRIGLGYCF